MKNVVLGGICERRAILTKPPMIRYHQPTLIFPFPIRNTEARVTFDELHDLLVRLQRGETSLTEAVERLLPAATPATVATSEASVDLDRARRCGYPEVVYAPGKTITAIADVFQAQLAHGQNCLATRVSMEQASALTTQFPQARHNAVARTLRIDARVASAPGRGRVAIITAGTSDLPIGEEAAETALFMGCAVDLIVDVGVAGPQRLPAQKHRFENADCIVVVAGMEGALPSVVGGHVSCPVIACPTSVGYGASFGGLAPLLGMLNSCAANVTVVNIDAGFKAGFVAGLIANRAHAIEQDT
jgi:pyridinium-3,5-biscarboxylic acid mononucleotide synthase